MRGGGAARGGDRHDRVRARLAAAVRTTGTLYIADTGASEILALSRTGRLGLVAGAPARARIPQAGRPAVQTSADGPDGLAFDRAGDLEQAATWRLAGQLSLDDEQRYSLICHHASAVEQRVARGRPDLGEPRRVRGHPAGAVAMSHGHRGLRRRAFLNVTAGWGTWFRNRRVGLRDRWFRLRTIRCYREAPQP